jgi:hypothetical protein
MCSGSKTSDIPHRGADCGEFSSVKPGILIAQELKQVLVLFRQVEHDGPLLWGI